MIPGAACQRRDDLLFLFLIKAVLLEVGVSLAPAEQLSDEISKVVLISRRAVRVGCGRFQYPGDFLVGQAAVPGAPPVEICLDHEREALGFL